MLIGQLVKLRLFTFYFTICVAVALTMWSFKFNQLNLLEWILTRKLAIFETQLLFYLGHKVSTKTSKWWVICNSEWRFKFELYTLSQLKAQNDSRPRNITETFRLKRSLIHRLHLFSSWTALQYLTLSFCMFEF